MRYEVEIGGRVREVDISRSSGRFVVTVDGTSWQVDAARLDAQTLSLLIAPGCAAGGSAPKTGVVESHEVTVSPDAASGQLIVRVGATPVPAATNGRRRSRAADDGAVARSGPQRIVAPMPGKIVRILVKTGEAVHARQPLVVVEAMKMENELRAARDGTVGGVHAAEGQSVEAGTLLVVIQ